MNVWQFVKEKSEYIWLALYLTMAGILYADDDPTGAWTLFGVGLFLFVVLKLAAAKRKRDVKRKQTWEQGELEALRRAGAEPVPTPGEKGYAGHDPENCIYCEVRDL